jgi:hypothetical protein
MAEYDGEIIEPLVSDNRTQGFFESRRMQSGSIFSTDKAHAGTYSLKIDGGGMHEIYYACDAGSKTITVWVWAPGIDPYDAYGEDAYDPYDIGSCAIQIFDETGTKIAEDWNTTTGSWEQLSVTFTALKKVYIVRLVNFRAAIHIDARAYFDDLV